MELLTGQPIHAWQVSNQIESYRIFVGEFGVWRKAPGADRYLKDVTDVFSKFGWAWAYYAFREDDWNVADLELSENENVRKETELFKIVKALFQ